MDTATSIIRETPIIVYDSTVFPFRHGFVNYNDVLIDVNDERHRNLDHEVLQFLDQGYNPNKNGFTHSLAMIRLRPSANLSEVSFLWKGPIPTKVVEGEILDIGGHLWRVVYSRSSHDASPPNIAAVRTGISEAAKGFTTPRQRPKQRGGVRRTETPYTNAELPRNHRMMTLCALAEWAGASVFGRNTPFRAKDLEALFRYLDPRYAEKSWWGVCKDLVAKGTFKKDGHYYTYDPEVTFLSPPSPPQQLALGNDPANGNGNPSPTP